MSSARVIVVGGGAAGFFAAIACAEATPNARVVVLERNARFLDKVRISGGGRCNVTHACFDPREFVAHYPRGGRTLLTPFQVFSARDTVAWFAARGVRLKAERDGRMFPVTDSSQTIVDCLVQAARASGVELRMNCRVESVAREAPSGFELTLPGRERLSCDRLLLATGGCRTASGGQLAVSLGHTLEPPVPSLFSFHVASPVLQGLAGVSLPNAEVSVPSVRLRALGPLLITHEGLSGPAVLRLSAWGARALHATHYAFALRVNWLPKLGVEQIGAHLEERRAAQGAKSVVRAPIASLPARLWERLVLAAGIAPEARWASLSRTQEHALVLQLTRSEFAVTGKSLNQDEFVTCGGVRVAEVNFNTMESRRCPGLHLAGELLDIDGLTGGFNFQAAWTTGFVAGREMGRSVGAVAQGTRREP